jgi:hypothetical protein
LRRLGYNAQKIQRPAAALALGIQPAQVLDQIGGGARLIRQFMFQNLSFSRKKGGNCEIRLHGRK